MHLLREFFYGEVHSRHANYANVEGLHEQRYVSMPPIEETLAISQ